MKQEIYRSEALGEIPLSFTGRHLLQSLRETIDEYTKKTLRRHGADMFTEVPHSAEDWKPLSIARGKLAQYMSKLEQRQVKERPRAYESRLDTMPRQEHFNCRSVANPFEVAGSVVATIEETEPKGGDVHIHMPAIPPGYVMRCVGNITTIEPVKPEPKDAAGFDALLTEYRHAIQSPQGAYGSAEAINRIHRINAAEKALKDAYES